MKMKKITGFVCALFFAQLSFGQITLEHSYNKIVSGIYKLPTDIMLIKHYYGDINKQTFTIYNLDHSIYKTIKLDIPEGASITSMSSFYTELINSDPLIEFKYTIKNTDSQNNRYDTFIINENGELIKRFENVDAISYYCTEDGNKLYAYNLDKVQIYSLPTTFSGILTAQASNRMLPYPNPANHIITIPYQLTGKENVLFIYNTNGQLIEQKYVDRNFSDLLLDVSSYTKGVYYYTVDKQKGKFIIK